MKRTLRQLSMITSLLMLVMQIAGCALLGRGAQGVGAQTALPSPTHKKIVLHGVEFDRSRGTVTRAARPVLDAAIDELREAKPVTVVVVGPFRPAHVRPADLGPLYCRGMGVEDYFSAHGIDAARIGNVELVDAPLITDQAATARAPKTCRVELDMP